jgi:hypothetical protein
MRRVLTPAVAIPVGIVAVAVLGLSLYLFQPWRLFTDVEVYEAAPVSMADVAERPSPSESTDSTSVPSPAPSGSASVTATSTPTGPVVLARGEFISHEHDTSGSVRILELADGTRVLRIEGLQTSDGPDLKVWLSDQPVVDGVDGWGVFDDGAYVSLGELKGNIGDQNYVISDDIDLSDYSAISIWCVRFSVSFGAAELTA